MKKKLREIIPKPRSVFLKVKCPDCGGEQVVFGRASITAKCNVCGAVLCEPTGGKAIIRGSVVATLD